MKNFLVMQHMHFIQYNSQHRTKRSSSRWRQYAARSRRITFGDETSETDDGAALHFALIIDV